MARQPDNEERVTVVGVRDDQKKFKARMPDGREQEFTVSTTNNVVAPLNGADILLAYNIQPSSNPQWPDDTWWANSIRAANGAGETPAPPMQRDNTTPPPPVAAEQPVPRYDSTTSTTPVTAPTPQKDVYQVEGDAKSRSAEWNTAVMTAREVLIANQSWEDPHMPITGLQVAAEARDIYYGKELEVHPEQPPQQQSGDPGPQY